ncbi:MAG: SNF2 helicase associated domain-containing protein, partial [Oscillospiraceae bacterium]
LALTVDDKKLTTVKTDIMAIEMLKQYADKMILEVSDTADGIVLTPTLDAFDMLPTISFKVGRDRMFVVKNVDQFVKAINGGENVAYGKQLSFVHTENAFADESKALVRFLLERYDKNNGLYESEYYTAPSVKSKKMYLPPFMLDEFFSLYENKSLDIICDSGKSEKVLVKNETPLLKLKIEKLVRDAFELTMQNGFSLIKGLRYIYIIFDDKIYKCNEEYSKEMFVFLNSIIENLKRKLIIAKEDMPSFTTNVLPILNKHLHIQTLCDFSQFAPPELKSIVYLDMPTSDKVTIRLRHQYGDKIHIGFAEKDTRQSFDLRGEVLIENIIYKYFSHPSVPGEMCIENDENALYELVENGVSEIAQH